MFLIRSKPTLARCELEYSSEDYSVEFGRKGMLDPRFIRPCEIIWSISPMAYQLILPSELEKIHNVFHFLMLQ
ncbi:coilin-like [Gossypium australe]|uniref:Coilin-like n=1 Tax=Gossypium australe TaxID=47621 RepID=A0A5B6VCB9_9ROSI|nr:coilin-like [Gossypium australe]